MTQGTAPAASLSKLVFYPSQTRAGRAPMLAHAELKGKASSRRVVIAEMIFEQRRGNEPTTLEVAPKKTRKLLSGQEECRKAVIEVTGLANRGLAILTPDLEPDVYDHDEFLEALKRFILARSFARVRVLIADPTRAIKNGNRFVTMGRRLNSYIEFRNVKQELRGQTEAYLIADESALVYRPNAAAWNGMTDTYEPAIARKYLESFDALWQACEPEPDLRQLSL